MPSESSVLEPSRVQRPAPQKQELPGEESRMIPEPMDEDPRYKGSGKLLGKVALVTGGDSGIGRAVSILFAKEGADVVIIYLNEEDDAERTRARIFELGRHCIKIAGDVGDPGFCQRAVRLTISELGHLDILVNNAAEQHVTGGVEEISAEQLEKTFRTNFFGYFNMVQAALRHLKSGDAIINTTSVQAYNPKPQLMDYASTKGAILNFTRSLARELVERGIRVNAVAPGPIWTPLIPASFSEDEIKDFGTDTPLGRAGQPSEVAPSYVFLASDLDSSYFTGQVLHPNGGSMMIS